MKLLLLATFALADLPPPDDFVETCTVAQQALDGKECVSCNANFGGREDCEAHEKTGYKAACKTYGASVWSEVLCRAGTAKPKTVEPTPTTPDEPKKPAPAVVDDDKGCAVVSAAGGWLLLGLTALLVRRRDC